MLTKNELLEYPNYLLTKYQNELYRQLTSYMESENLSQREIANKMNVSNSYISQILNGNFNFTLKKLIELSLFMGKVPKIEFIDSEKYWEKRERENFSNVNWSLIINYDKPLINPSQPDYESIPQEREYSISAKKIA